jgi:hypothetical protein
MKNLPRYTVFVSISCGKPVTSFKLDPNGQWVNFSDLKDVLKPSHNTSKCEMQKHHRALRLHGIKQCGSCGCDLR